MYFQGPFLLLNEKNGHYFEIDKININTEFDQVCKIDFYLGQNHNNEYELNDMFYKDKLLESIDGRQGFSKSFLADYILYELIKVNKKTYRKKKSLELKVGLLISHNFEESYCTVNFDYFIVNSDSKLLSYINNEQNLYNQEHQLQLETVRLLLNQNVYDIEEYEIDQKEKKLDEIQNSWGKFTPCGLYKLWVNGRF